MDTLLQVFTLHQAAVIGLVPGSWKDHHPLSSLKVLIILSQHGFGEGSWRASFRGGRLQGEEEEEEGRGRRRGKRRRRRRRRGKRKRRGMVNKLSTKCTVYFSMQC